MMSDDEIKRLKALASNDAIFPSQVIAIINELESYKKDSKRYHWLMKGARDIKEVNSLFDEAIRKEEEKS